MDPITAFAASIDNPLLKSVGMLVDNDLVFAALVICLIWIGEARNSKRTKILLSVGVTLVLAASVKYLMAEPRPCAGQIWCPDDYSFPSIHSAVAFTLMTGFLSKKSYPAYLLFALFIGFTRMNIGVHTFTDVAGALPIALISYYIIFLAWPHLMAMLGWKNE